MKLKIMKNSIWNFSYSILFLIPYFEIGIVRDKLEVRTNDYIIEASIVLLFIFSLIMTGNLIRKRTLTKESSIIQSLYILMPIQVILLFISVALKVSFITLLYFYMPIIFADLYHCSISKLNRIDLIKSMVNAFSTYLVINIIVNFRVYGFSLNDISNERRLISPGGGPVALGYTICIVFLLMLSIEQYYKRNTILIISILFLGTSFLTGSRGSMWPVLIVFLFYWIKNLKRSLIILVVAIVLVSLNLDTLIAMFPRLFSIGNESRILTWIGCIDIFCRSGVVTQVFGRGFGNFYPYNSWLNNIADGARNLFVYDSHILLVQPHNNWIYMLIEGGVFGNLILITPFSKIIKKSILKKNYKFIGFCMMVILLCSFDSLLFVAPGTAALWWIAILLIYDGI